MLLERAQNLQTSQLHETTSGKPSSLSLFGITAAEDDLIDILLTRSSILARLGMIFISLANDKTGQAVVRDFIFPAGCPRVSLACLKSVRDIRGMVSKDLEEDSLNAT